ncbi:hypothetical protein EFR21_05415 [Lactobacillus delbrueckii subsp. bulgaricus]|nr:N-formylglutamate amidohydrolase [Lactobacillus delbrueckii]MCT3466525.1 hypothetical protein [Lactobacillus delbrueckii subsp. bulgaricus]MCT3470627.1 hypothetical protein [Lactobacillus delbrueckii subsp. bulgaricus]RHX66854.1 hypothetical protein DSY26_03425 [Lactobacillus delbrueckii]
MIFLPGLGFTVLENNLNRYLIDPNRDPNEGLTGDYYHLVYAKNTFGHALYQTPPSSWKINRRRGQFYQPYHQQLQKLLSIKKDTFRNCLVIIVGYHPNRGVLKTLALIIRMVLDSSYLV